MSRVSKLVLGGLLLLVNLFLSIYYDGKSPLDQVNHPFFDYEYPESNYYYQIYLHCTPLIYLLVFAVLKVRLGWVTCLIIIHEFFRVIDFYLYYADGLLDSHVTSLVIGLTIVFRISELIVKTK